MTAKRMEGRPVAQIVRKRVKEEISNLRDFGIKPLLATIIIGEDPASLAYLKSTHSACLDAEIQVRNIELRADISQHDLNRTVDELNRDAAVTGIILQLPLPKELDEAAAINEISPRKDVDGLHPFNLGQLWQKSARLVPCTPKGVIVLLKYYGIPFAGKRAVIINRTKVVGRPLAQLLLNEDATVTICHSKTQHLKEIALEADILVTGIGRREQFTVGADMIKPNAVVVDIGTSSVGGKLVGDVDFDSSLSVAAFVTPVPGGVGPMTTAMLLYNMLVAASIQRTVSFTFNPEKLGSFPGQ